ncbi:MAG: hypothetical protein D6784_17020 [Chloroflexi bacterium]|nr:MAG: hypothetical protein D6784_17020 [Chloroflexota bacterium]
MKRYVLLAALLVAAVLVVSCGVMAQPEQALNTSVETAAPAAPAADQPVEALTFEAPQYVGAEKCKECHEEIYDSASKTGHFYKLNKVVDGKPPEYPYSEVPNPPEGYTWDDISYVIGGFGWKARFIDKQGFIITGEKVQYNLYNEDLDMGENWVAYEADVKEKPYTCGTCHTTGYNPEGHQDGLPGLVGTWAEPGIKCEACHGPGSQHAENPYLVEMKVDRDSELCGSCHRRGEVESIDAKGGFIKHHEQYEELFESKKRVMRCVDCHNPHETVKYAKKLGIRTACENCHFENAKFQKITDRKHAECVDCHMPRVTKSALGDPARFSGDIRTHLMAINPFSTSQFDEEGKFSQPYLSLDFACKSCHYEGGPASVVSDEELVDMAVGYHDRDKAGSANGQ